MQTIIGLPTPQIRQPVMLTVGNFDGVHRGHQMLINELTSAAHATGALAGLLTFEPHPLTVLRPDISIPRLTGLDERAVMLEALGLDLLISLPFSRAVAGTPAIDFMVQLMDSVNLRGLWIGPDFALGRGREGNATRLSEIGATIGYSVRVVPPFDWHGEPVRSSRIRSLLLEQGAVREAGDFLGRPYQVWGEVSHGAQRGRKLGFPTANLAVPPDRLIPAHGVYACWAWRGDSGLPAVVNIGVRPSFDNGRPSVEAFVMDFEEDIYGEVLGLSFVERLRGEMKFDDIGQLIAQIRQDAEQGRRILTDPPPHHPLEGQANWEEIEHVADWAVRVRGDDQRQLFANAAIAMFAMEQGQPNGPVSFARAIQVSSDDLGGLLVAWLNALLFEQETRGEMYSRFDIFELSDRGLRGVAYGRRGAPDHTAIKAVTYHELDVAQTSQGWSANITFDV